MARIMTYNVHSCRGTDGKLDVGRIAEVIAQSRPDIVALQELDCRRHRTGGVDQAHAIAEKLGMTFHFNAALKVAEESYGDAILTSLPMTLVKTGPLPNLRDVKVRGRTLKLEPRGAVWVELTIDGRKVQVINTHLGLVPPEQRLQAAHMLGPEWLGHPKASAPLIMMGDFNATPRYAAYQMIAKRLKDARRLAGMRHKALTFPSRMPLIRIDHIFVSDGVAVGGMHAPDSELAKVASDHRPLVADIHIA